MFSRISIGTKRSSDSLSRSCVLVRAYVPESDNTCVSRVDSHNKREPADRDSMLLVESEQVGVISLFSTNFDFDIHASGVGSSCRLNKYMQVNNRYFSLSDKKALQN